MARCMLHLERSDFPELFSQNNSLSALDADVTALVKNGAITCDQELPPDPHAHE
jgi:hypothetical protein